MKTIAVAGTGAVGSTICRALIDGIDGFALTAAADLDPDAARKRIKRPGFDLPFVPLDTIVNHADWIVEALPVSAVPALTRHAIREGKALVMITSAALLLYPDLLHDIKTGSGRVLVPSGAIAGLDGLTALAGQGIKAARLITSKPPRGLINAPYIVKKDIDLDRIRTRTRIFNGSAVEAATAFPANINVAATLTLASDLPPEEVQVEIYAAPDLTANCHEIIAKSDFSTLRLAIENRPDPANPKSSALTAHSIIATLKRQNAGFRVGG